MLRKSVMGAVAAVILGAGLASATVVGLVSSQISFQ